MNLIALIPQGQTEITVNGLHQWDYGQKLQIIAEGLPGIVEVHFASPGMKEAVVRTSSVVDGAAIASIPDVCLEQSAPVTAWVYAIEGTTGYTALTIHLPVIARARPAAIPEPAIDYSTKYTEMVTAVNEQISIIKQAGRNAETFLGLQVEESISEIEELTQEAESRVREGLIGLETGQVVPLEAKSVNKIYLSGDDENDQQIVNLYPNDQGTIETYQPGVLPYLLPLWKGIIYAGNTDRSLTLPETLSAKHEYEAVISIGGSTSQRIRARGYLDEVTGVLQLTWIRGMEIGRVEIGQQETTNGTIRAVFTGQLQGVEFDTDTGTNLVKQHSANLHALYRIVK